MLPHLLLSSASRATERSMLEFVTGFSLHSSSACQGMSLAAAAAAAWAGGVRGHMAATGTAGHQEDASLPVGLRNKPRLFLERILGCADGYSVPPHHTSITIPLPAWGSFLHAREPVSLPKTPHRALSAPSLAMERFRSLQELTRVETGYGFLTFPWVKTVPSLWKSPCTSERAKGVSRCPMPVPVAWLCLPLPQYLPTLPS